MCKASEAEGLEIDREARRFPGEDYHVESWPFPETAVQDGVAVEKEAPRSITDQMK